MKRIIIQTIGILIFAIIVTVAIVTNNGAQHLISYSNAFFITGFILILISILVLFSNKGSYSFFSYPFLKNKTNKDKEKMYNSYEDYTQKQAKSYSKTAFLPYLIIGSIFTTIGIIISLCI